MIKLSDFCILERIPDYSALNFVFPSKRANWIDSGSYRISLKYKFGYVVKSE